LEALEGERNTRIFQQEFSSVDRVFQLIVEDDHTWALLSVSASFGYLAWGRMVRMLLSRWC
jgi:hypothetical protein